MGGTTARVTGPRAPITQDQKRAGRSRDDQRQYRMGCCQKRGARPDILAAVDGVLEEIERGSCKGWMMKATYMCSWGWADVAVGLCLLPSRAVSLSLPVWLAATLPRVKSERSSRLA